MTPVHLTPITQTRHLRIAENLPRDARWLLPDIHSRLHRAAEALPEGMTLLVIEAFRTQARQFALWNGRLAQLARLAALDAVQAAMSAGSDPAGAIASVRSAPDDIGALRRATRVTVADPVDTPSGHQCGSAVDVTILGAGGPLDMGTQWADFAEITATVNPLRTHSPDITPEQAANRAILLGAMEGQGLVNYPEEWWHFSFGDALWHEVMTARGGAPGPVVHRPIFDNPAFSHHRAD
jgi:zinc D-Ala-D-Ala dipeptidase